MLFNHDLGLIDTIQTLDVTTLPPAGGIAGQLQILGNGGLVLTIGTTAQRPASPINGTIRYNTDLARVESFQGGSWVSNAGGTLTSVQIAGGVGITAAGGPITTSGTITLTLGTELQGLSALATNGFVVRTAAGAYAGRTLTGTAGNIVITGGDGTGSGNPTVNLATVGTAVTNFFGRQTTDAFGRVTSNTAATSGDIITALGFTPVNKAGDTMTGALNFGGFTATNLGAPSAGSDAATKNYVDAATSGLSWKQAVRAATTTAGTLATSFANGSSIDGVTLVTGDRILIKNQATASENGIYTVNASGAPTRALDMNVSAEFPNATVYVSQGTTFADTGWTQTGDNITIGTTAVTFTQFSGSGAYTAGSGLTLTGNTFSISAPIATTLGGTGLTTIGSANQVLGVNTAGTGLEYKTVTAGTAISVSQVAGSITINNTGVTSAVAGAGISLSAGSGTVTITNTGVTSVNASTTSAALTISGGPVTTTGTLVVNAQADINALASFNAGTGIPVRTAANTWALRSIGGTTNQITVTNGNGVGGNPVLGLAANAILPGTVAVIVPSGTSAQQPAPSDGAVRFNTTTNRLMWSNEISWSNVGTGDGSVTSVGLTLPSIFTVSGSPVTSAGTLSASLSNQLVNSVFAGPSIGASGVPSFRTLVYSDMPYRLQVENPVTPVISTATGANSQTLGSGANATLIGQIATASGRFAANGDAQSSTFVLRNTTSSATLTELFLDGASARMIVPNNSVWTFDILVSGRRTDATGGAAGYRFNGVLRKDTTSGSIAFVGVPSKQVLGETTASMDSSVAVDLTNGSLNVRVVGIAAQTFRWVAVVRTSEVRN